MKLAITFILLTCSLSSVAEICNTPSIIDKTIVYKEPSIKKQNVHFGARYVLSLDNPQNVIFSNDILIYNYGDNKNQRKTISFQPIVDTLTDSHNKYSAQEAYKIAFGLTPDTAKDDFIYNIRKSLKLCNGNISNYHFKGINELVIRVNIKIMGDNDSLFYVFSKTPPFMDMVQFSNFSDKEVDEILSTLRLIKMES